MTTIDLDEVKSAEDRVRRVRELTGGRGANVVRSSRSIRRSARPRTRSG
jgi:hypothetical protein